jgi:hypothetical protein
LEAIAQGSSCCLYTTNCNGQEHQEHREDGLWQDEANPHLEEAAATKEEIGE